MSQASQPDRRPLTQPKHLRKTSMAKRAVKTKDSPSARGAVPSGDAAFRSRQMQFMKMKARVAILKLRWCTTW